MTDLASNASADPAATQKSLAFLRRRNVVAAGLLGFLVLPALADEYLLFVGNLALIYMILTVGLNILIGYTGMLAFMNGALFGVGAYASGLLRLELGWPFWLALPAGAMVAMAVGVVIALPALRLTGLYLALATVAFAQFALWVFLHWVPVTRGPAGFQLPKLEFGAAAPNPEIGLYYLTLALAVVVVALSWNLVRSRIGRAFVAIRESEVAAESLSIDLFRYKTIAYAVSALFAGLAGGLFAPLLGIVVPESYDLFQVIIQFAMVVVGGIGSIWGAVFGAIALVWIQEVLRAFKELQEIAFGGLILLTVIFLPGGLISLLKRFVPGWEEPFERSGRRR